jgi:RNA polymerase sigma-54 factor
MPLTQLEAYLREQMEENPVLELHQDPPERAPMPDAEALQDRLTRRLEDRLKDLWHQAEGTRNGNHSQRDEEDGPIRETPAPPPSLYEHLVLQLRCLRAEEARTRLAETLLAWLDPDGYLRTPIEEIAAAERVPTPELEAALPLIHLLDPAGVGARSLQECLLIQLQQRGQADSLAARILRDGFALFAHRKIRELASKLGAGFAEIQQACRSIAQLEPKPARNFLGTDDPTAYAVPDVIVREVQGDFVVELNDERMPRVALSARYRSLLRDPTAAPEARVFVRQKLRQAVWVMKAVQQRRDTLLSLCRALVELERGYFLHGVGHLQALTQETLAKRIGCHASTVSRAIAGKRMQTPHGVLPLDAFFGGGIVHPRDAGVTVSARTIQAEIQHLVDGEDGAKPLSDQAIEAALRAKGYPIARRTVAKYRTALKILPAHLRRQAF